MTSTIPLSRIRPSEEDDFLATSTISERLELPNLAATSPQRAYTRIFGIISSDRQSPSKYLFGNMPARPGAVVQMPWVEASEEALGNPSATTASMNMWPSLWSHPEHTETSGKTIRISEVEGWHCQATGSGKRRLREELMEMYNRCSTDNWNGEGAKAMSFDGYCLGEKFLAALPPSIRRPDVTVDPDGEFDFEWRKGDSHLASVSISPLGEVTYAGIYGPARIRGKEVFDGEIPTMVLEAIRRVFKD